MWQQQHKVEWLVSEQSWPTCLLAVVLGNATSYEEKGRVDPLFPLFLRSRWSQLQESLKDRVMTEWLYDNVTAGQQASADGEGAGETK